MALTSDKDKNLGSLTHLSDQLASQEHNMNNSRPLLGEKCILNANFLSNTFQSLKYSNLTQKL